MRLFAPYRLIGGFCLLALSLNAQLQRVPNTTLAMPQVPPVLGYTTTNAFPGLVLTNPVCIASPPGETNRLFILSKNGVITGITNLALQKWTTFMDLTPQVSSQSANSGTAGERGLLGMAFHPGFATNGYFFILYMPTNMVNGNYFDRLARFKISAANPNLGDTNSQVVIYDQVDRDPNHNAGDIHFGPDGYLYVSVGDEGAEHDGRNCAQVITNSLFSGLLRIDVDKRPGNLTPNPGTPSLIVTTNYLIPADNPFVGISSFDGLTVTPSMVRTEFYAVGLRNPWRWNFDFYTNAFGTNVLYCGDVGQDQYEEVDVIQKGDNLGWAYWEGTNISSGGTLPHDSYITTSGTQIRFPIVQYAHGTAPNQGNCVIGGVVYRGVNLPQLYGSYLYADYVDGNIWTMTASNYTTSVVSINGSASPSTPIVSDSTLNITAFGTDPRNGDVLMCATKTTGYATAATINKIIYNSTATGQPIPATLYDAGVFTNLLSLTSPQDALQPAPGIVPYIINVPFWSDNAIKSRWLSVPNTNLTISFDPNVNWSFPTGTIWIKHFNLQLTNGDPTSEIRLETRLLVKNPTGVYGVTYRWGGSQTNAALVSASGLDENFAINDGGTIRTQTWHYPSQNECITCHTAAGGFGLGTRTSQLNCSYDYGFGPTNEIQALSGAGYFSSPVTNDPSTLLTLAAATNTSASLELRARSFLAANCSQCHQPAGTVSQANWDARIATPTALAGLINGTLINNLGNASNYVIAPLSPANSVLLTRISTRGANSIQMPPLDSSIVDTTATNLITQWILSLTNTFWLSASPDPQSVVSGNSASYTIAYVATSDFTSNVSLTISGLPTGASGGFSPATVSRTATNSTLTITTTSATPGGTFPLTVTGIGGGQTNSDTMNLVVFTTVPTAPGTLVWTNGSGTDSNWSTPLNWTNISNGGNGPPGPANNLLFTNYALAASPSAPNNFADSAFTIGSLQYANNAATPNYQVTQIQSGQSVTVTNGIMVGTGTDAGAGNVINAIITGAGGNLNLTGGILSVAQTSGTDGGHLATLDLSGLDNFSATISHLNVGAPNSTVNARAAGVLLLAKTNTITISSTGLTNGLLVAWNGNTGASTPGATKPSLLYLGQTNGIYADTISVGSVKTPGALMAFNPTGLNNPSAYFRGLGGSSSRVSLWAIGNDSPQNNSNQSTSGTNDFTGGTVDALVNNLAIGVTSTGNSGGGISASGVGVLTFNAGNFDVNNITNGWSLGTGTVTNNGVGVINVNGGTLKVNNVLAMGFNTGGGFSGESGTLNIRNGTVLANSIVSGGGTNIITLNNAVLTITNRAGAPGLGISTFAITNSTLRLRLNGNAAGTNIVVSNLLANGSSVVVIDAVANIGGLTTFPLISYTGIAPTPGSFVKGALPAGFAANLVNNTAQKRIDLVIAPSTTVTPRFNSLMLNGTNLFFGGSNGFPNAFFSVLASTNLTLPINQWLPVATNPFDVNGGFNFTNPVNPGALQWFYLLQLQ